MIGILHQVQKAQWHQEAANELAGLAIEKWGYGKYRDYLGDYGFGTVTESVRPGEVAPLLGNVENYLAVVGQAKEPSAFANASAGFGNGITFGLIGWANREAGLDTNYSETSDAFRYGNYGGAAAGIVLTGGAGALEYGVARTATWMGVGAGTGFGIATLQTGADMLDGKDVTWGGYLEHAGISALYGAYGGAAFGLAGPTARTALGIVGSGAQLGEGAYQISNGNYARGTLDVGLGALGGHLTLRPTPTTPANRISERDLLNIRQPAKTAAPELPLDDVAAVLDGAAVPTTAAEIRAAAAAGDETAQALVGQFDRAAPRQAATRAERGDIGAIASADGTGTTMVAKGGIKNLSTSTTYHVEDAADPNLWAMGEVRNGVLELSLQTRYPKLGGGYARGALRGEEQFDAIVRHFEGRFTAIRGRWIDGDNLAHVRLNGSPETSWTGIQARRHGFTNATLTGYEYLPGTDDGMGGGVYDWVEFLFTR
jgi:hypothetical protein